MQPKAVWEMAWWVSVITHVSQWEELQGTWGVCCVTVELHVSVYSWQTDKLHPVLYVRTCAAGEWHVMHEWPVTRPRPLLFSGGTAISSWFSQTDLHWNHTCWTTTSRNSKIYQKGVKVKLMLLWRGGWIFPIKGKGEKKRWINTTQSQLTQR